MTPIERICTQSGTRFIISDEDQNFYEKVGVPLPTLSPRERLRRRLSWRNEWNFYRRDCDRCKNPIISVYNDTVQNVYCTACWWSDHWDGTEYGQNYDPSRSFFEQWKEVWDRVPKLALMNDNGVSSLNCEYTTDFANGKNVYMVAEAWYDEDCMYGTQMNYCKDSVDSSFVFQSELMYEGVICQQCYDCQNCTACSQCNGCIYGYDLRNCSDCLFSVGLRNKQYYIWNKPYSKEDYFRIKEAFDLGSWSKRKELEKQFEAFVKQFPYRYANLTQCENSTGNNLVRCKNAKDCFNFYDIQDGRYLISGDGAKDCYDLYCVGRAQLSYEGLTPDNSYLARFCINTWQCNVVDYSDNCHASQNLFGCVGLKRKKNCVLNKQINTPEQFHALKMQIIEDMTTRGEWGEFFPISLSPFPYQDTLAQDYFPMGGEKDTHPTGAAPAALPDSIGAATDELCQTGFACETCGKGYRILRRELQFYRAHTLPVPRSCAVCRNRARSLKMNPKELWNRSCDRCGLVLQSPFAPNRPEKILCEACYLLSTV